jgi:hypothetical protein
MPPIRSSTKNAIGRRDHLGLLLLPALQPEQSPLSIVGVTMGSSCRRQSALNQTVFRRVETSQVPWLFGHLSSLSLQVSTQASGTDSCGPQVSTD